MDRRLAGSPPARSRAAQRWLAPGLLSIMLAGTLAVPATTMAASPAAGIDRITTLEDTPATGNVLDNDSDADGDPITVASYTPLSSTYGTLTIAEDGAYTYTPAANWNGDVPATYYHVSDGTSTALGYIQIQVTAVNDDPVAVADTVTVTEDTATDVTDQLTANDTDVEGDTISVTGASAATGGAVAFAAGAVTFTPTENLCGPGVGSFDYAISDGNGGTDSAHVTVNLTCVNDAPVAVADTITVDEDTPTDVTAQLIANDTDLEDDALSIASASSVAGGQVAIASGMLTFTPALNLCGAGVGGFDYVVSDGNGGTDSAHVTVNVTCVNDAPVAVADTAMADQASGAASYDVLANDSDPDGDTLSLVSASVSSAAGTASVAGGQVTFTPLPSFHGEVAISYVVSDGALTTTGTLTVTVGPDVTAPTVSGPTISMGSGRVNEISGRDRRLVRDRRRRRRGLV